MSGRVRTGGNPEPWNDVSVVTAFGWRAAMKWVLVGCAAIALSNGAAFAGPCSQEITALQRSLSSRDAGSGTVQTGSGSGTSSQISEAGSSVRSTSEASRSAAEVRGMGQDSRSTERVGPTGAMGQAAAGSAASAQDVRLQQQGQPTQAEAARSGTPAAAAGEDKLQRVAADLDRARRLDLQSDSGCMDAVNDARKNIAAD